MNKSKSYFIIFMMIAAMISAAACSSAPAGTATVSINTGLGSEKSAVTKAPAPMDVTYMYIEVVGSDMEPVAGVVVLSGNNINIPTDLQPGTDDSLDNYNIVPVSYDSATGSLTLSVPAGTQREFVVVAATEVMDAYYMGTATADLLPDVVNPVEITMALYTGGFTTAVVSMELLLNGQPFENLITLTLGLYTGTVEISGPDITTITEPLLLIPGYQIYAPVGSSRTFKVTLNIDPSDPGVVLAWEGTVTADVVTGNNNVQVAMAIAQTKIVIPDYLNSRVVQIDNFDTPNWIPKVGTGFGLTGNISPYDIDFDSLGRIYILNNIGAGNPDIMRIDNITSTTYVSILNISMLYTAIAIDRNNSYLYYATTSQLFRSNLDGSSPITLQGSTITNIRGIAVDDSGMLYIACSNSAVPSVVAYNPGTTSIIHSYSTGLVTPWDVIVKASYVYVSDLGSADVIQLPLDLSAVTGTLYQSAGGDYFSEPSRFVAILNRKFYILDDGYNNPDVNSDRIISFDDIGGTGWAPYGANGTGDGQFQFYLSHIC